MSNRPNIETALPNLIAAINGDRPPRHAVASIHELTELLKEYPPDPVCVNDDVIFGATSQQVYPKFLRIIPASRATLMEAAADYTPADYLYEVRLEWFSNHVPVVVLLWEALAARILAAPMIQVAMRFAGWNLTEPGDDSILTMRDALGRSYGHPFVHFTGGAVLAWWRINEPDLHPDFLKP